MTTLELVLALFQSVFFIIAGAYLNSQDEQEFRWKHEILERKIKSKKLVEPITVKDMPKREYGGLVVFYCGIFGLFATLAILIFFY